MARVTLQQVRLLLAVARTGSIGAAGRHLSLTQSAASQSIAGLERSLGETLVTRTRTGVSLTAFARTLLDDAGLADAAMRRIEGRAMRRAAAKVPPLRIACVTSATRRLLPGWRRSFRHLYPDVPVTVFEGHHVEGVDWVRDRVADLGIAAIAPDDMVARSVHEEDMLFVRRRDDRTADGDPMVIGPPAGRVLVAAGRGCEALYGGIFRSLRQPEPPMVACSDVATALEMVRGAVGIALLPRSALPETLPPDLRADPFCPPLMRSIYALTRTTPVPGDAAFAFLALLGEARTSPALNAPSLPNE